MPAVFTIDGPRRGRRRKRKARLGAPKLAKGTCGCFKNPHTKRGTRICKDQSGRTRIKGRC